jgi:hypothetical protein
MRLPMGSMSLTTLAVEACCRTVGYSALAIIRIDDQLHRKAKRPDIGASITVSRARRQRRIPPRAASRAS